MVKGKLVVSTIRSLNMKIDKPILPNQSGVFGEPNLCWFHYYSRPVRSFVVKPFTTSHNCP